MKSVTFASCVESPLGAMSSKSSSRGGLETRGMRMLAEAAALATVVAARAMADKRKATNPTVCRWECIVPFRDRTQAAADKVRMRRGPRWPLDLRER
jgi:hypothetical protein